MGWRVAEPRPAAESGPMADDRLRELERRAATTGQPADVAAVQHERRRLGLIVPGAKRQAPVAAACASRSSRTGGWWSKESASMALEARLDGRGSGSGTRRRTPSAWRSAGWLRRRGVDVIGAHT